MNFIQWISLAVLLPLAACGIQWGLWEAYINPYVWFMFFPAVFICAWFGGWRCGLIGTIFSSVLVWQIFIPAQIWTGVHNFAAYTSTGLFILTGISLSWFHERYKNALWKTGETLRNKERDTRLAIEAALRDRDSKLEAIIGHSPSALSLKYPDGRYALANPNVQRIHHLNEEDIIGKTDFDLYPEEIATALKANDQLVLSTLARHSIEEIVPVEGQRRTFMSHIFPIQDQSGPARFICRISLDITDSKADQLALRQSEAKFRILAETATDWIFWIGVDGQFIYVSPACTAISGYEPQDFMDNPQLMTAIAHPADRSLIQQHHADNPHQTESTFDFRIFHKNGSIRWISHHVHRIYDENGKYLGQRGSNLDITSRKTTESERYVLSEALRQSSQPLLLGDPQAVVTYVNPAFTRLFGYESDDLVGKPIRNLVSSNHGDLDAHTDAIEQVYQRGTFSFETERLAHDGRHIPVLINLGAIRDHKGNSVGLIASYVDLRWLRENETTLRKLSLAVEQSPESIIITDLDGKIEYVNTTFTTISGYSREDVIGKNPRLLQSNKTPEKIYTDLWNTLRQGHVWHGEFINRRKDGCEYPESVIIAPMRQSDGRITHYVALQEDITERKRAFVELYKFKALVDSTDDAIIGKTLSGIITSWNHGAEKIYGYQEAEAIGRPSQMLIPAERLHEETDILNRIALGERIEHFETVRCRKDGRLINISATISPIQDEAGNVVGVSKIARDITANKKAEEQIKDLAFYDPLTRLPNRRLLMDRLKQGLVASIRNKRDGGLMFIDLDNFKSLNDTFGHAAGDQLLQHVAKLLVGCVREGDTVARLGGDEFVVMLEGLSENSHDAAAQTKSIGEKILTTLGQPLIIGTHKYQASASIGATIFGTKLNNIDELLIQADIGMYQAKAAGRNALRFFDPELQAAIKARTALEVELRRGIKNGQLRLHYQPQVDKLGQWKGAEVLVRWLHPTRGLISPSEFIPLAEETGLILPLGEWVLETACAQLAQWENVPIMADLTIAVNVSARQLQQTNFVDQVLAVFKRTQVNPQKLKLELTESLFVEDAQDVIHKMSKLRATGVNFSLDDFGTGYSSLSYLKLLPLAQLKIDQSFVRDLLTDQNDAIIAKSIVALAQSLGLSVIAEGVETLEQRDFLAQSGCHNYQGYLYSRPLTLEDFELNAGRPPLQFKPTSPGYAPNAEQYPKVSL